MGRTFVDIKLKIQQHNTLIKNFSYLSVLQIFNMIFPIITYPYLIRVLGTENYGLVIFAQTVVAYFVVLVGFGFNISATREISIHRDDKEKLSEIVSSIFIIKGFLFILSCLFMVGVLFLLPQAKGFKLLFVLSLWACLYDVIFPIWYFQGIEQMKYITYITLVSRLVFLCFIFIFIHLQSDYLFVPIIYGLGAVISGGIALYLIFYKHQLRFIWQPYIVLKRYFQESIPMFYSNVSISLYASTNKIIVGYSVGMVAVAYYDLAEKLISIFKIPIALLGQSLFPKISKEKNLQFVYKIFKLSVSLNVLLFILTLVCSKYIIIILGGAQMLPAQSIVNILAITLPILAMSNIFGMQLLIPFGYVKQYTRVIISSGFFYLILILFVWLSVGFSIINISIVTVLTEIYGVSLHYYYCKKNQLWA